MGCHGEFQLGRESDCQDIVEIIKFTIKVPSWISNVKLLFLLRKNRVYSWKYWCYCCYCCYYYYCYYCYYYYYYYYYYGYFTANWTHARYQATPCSLGCLAPFLTINNSHLYCLIKMLLKGVCVACYQELLVGINISKACTQPQNPS